MESVAGAGAVVTGGASGIGRALCAQLGKRGARIVIADVDGAALERAVAELRGAGVECHGVSCDVTSLADVTRLADEAFRLLGRVHLVAANAGVAVIKPALELTHDDWRWVVDVDLWGVIHCVEALVPRLVAQGEGGHLLFTSSFAGLVANDRLAAYCAAKYGVVGLAEVLWRELREHRIGVTVLCPMRVDTDILAAERHRGAEYGNPDPIAGTGAMHDHPGAGGILAADEVAAVALRALLADRLYALPHAESRPMIERRFRRIAAAFDQQAAERADDGR